MVSPPATGKAALPDNRDANGRTAHFLRIIVLQTSILSMIKALIFVDFMI